VIIHDLDIVCIAIVPNKTKTILIVDTNAVLALSITRQRLEPIPSRDGQIGKICSPMEDSEFSQRRGSDVRWNVTAFAGLPKQLRIAVFEVLDQEK
jgi:hypothetical protein